MNILDGFKKRLAESKCESEKANIEKIIRHWEDAKNNSDDKGE